MQRWRRLSGPYGYSETCTSESMSLCERNNILHALSRRYLGGVSSDRKEMGAQKVSMRVVVAFSSVIRCT